MLSAQKVPVVVNYDVDILDLSTGEVRRTPMWVGWTQYSPDIYIYNMCDCNLYGYRERGFTTSRTGGWEWEGVPHETVAYRFLKQVGCDHGMPPKHYRAVTAYLNDGRIYEFSQHRFIVS